MKLIPVHPEEMRVGSSADIRVCLDHDAFVDEASFELQLTPAKKLCPVEFLTSEHLGVKVYAREAGSVACTWRVKGSGRTGEEVRGEARFTISISPAEEEMDHGRNF